MFYTKKAIILNSLHFKDRLEQRPPPKPWKLGFEDVILPDEPTNNIIKVGKILENNTYLSMLKKMKLYTLQLLY